MLHYCLGWAFSNAIHGLGNISCVDYSSNGLMIAVGGMTNNTTLIYDATTLKVKLTINPPSTASFSTSVKFNPSNTLLAIGYHASGFVVVNVSNGAAINSNQSGQIVNSVDFSPN
jgi:WD40 repeat protein